MSTHVHTRLLPLALTAISIIALASGCAGTSTGDTTSKEPLPAPRPIGGDRDAHGCLAPAGYTWCARERDCVRPWELAKQANFENTAEGFAAYCSTADSPTTP
ncbi:MAG: hypothetical protein HOP03_14790 [Lysobacter sp.]|nr:hypothetical protein [Lysobacter sp.]